MKMRYGKFLKNQAGYSVIESLTALALLTAVLLPACALTARLVSSQMIQTQVTAIILAQKVLEETVDKKEFVSQEWRVKQDNINWIVHRTVETVRSLIFIRVEIISERNNRCIYRLQTCRPVR